MIAASYATGPVTSPGSTAGGLVGTIATPFTEATIRASYATGTVSGTIVGGLVGHVYDEGIITASYATGRVDGRNEGGLVGDDEGGAITNSYWDTRTSGQGSGSPGSGRTTSQLQSPTGYSGIYGSWNLDIDEDNMNDNLWNFGTSSQYPALRTDMDGDDDETWEEFGYQLRSGPTLTATPTTNAGQSQVELEWTQVTLSSEWTPAPSVSYSVTREDDDAIDTIAENLTVREYTDTGVAGETYIYQVVAVVDGGEAVRSATVSVTVAGNKRPVAVGALRNRRLLVGDSAMMEVGGAFEDPEGDTITYDVSSSDITVAGVTRSGSRVTIIPVAEGSATITVTATDDGSNQSRTQQFTVRVLPTTTVDYDTDDDGLIEISNLAQLDAVRHYLNGYGVSYSTPYAEAFTNGGGNVLACGGLLGCVGYELNDDLDFDTDNSGEADAGDTYWNNGAGWVPIGDSSSSSSSFAAIFEGNGRTITNLFIDSSGNDIGLFGATRSSAVIRNLEMVSVQVAGTDNVGGLVGSNGGALSACYATGKVSGDDVVGGLVGANLDDGSVSASYSTVQVTGDDRIGGLAGSNSGEVTAAYATGRVVGDSETGGLIGGNTGDVNISYATGLVSGRSTVGGLVGRNSGGGNITGSYWDSGTSGRTSGSYGQAKNSEELQLPTAASDIYQTWNVDLDGDSMNDDPWHFGTSSQYPVLSVDTNGVGGATWQEFGQQIQTGPALMPTTALGQVTLTWSAVSSATYNLYRTSGTTVAILSENTSSRSYVDTDVTAGATYVYQVAAVINGGEASRSPQASVVVPMPGMMPSVTLQLMPTSISENGGSSTVTASLSHTSTATTTVTVSAAAVSPAVSGDFSLSSNKTLTIGAGQSASTGTVTITANNNGVDAPNKTVMVTGTATNSEGVTGPSNVTLTIRDDDATPVITTAALILVAENETVVATLQATDEDDRTEDLVWSITGGNDQSQFTLMGGGRLAFKAAKDYEESDDSDRDGDYEVTVQVSDGFNAVEVDFTVRLQDVDDTAPTVSKLEITSDPGTDRTYAAGDEIQVTVTFSETVEVTGSPRLQIELGGGSRTADYQGGSGTAALVFEYEVAEGESDTDGVGVEADSLSGGTIRDEARNNAELGHEVLAANSGHKVDGVRPELAATGGAVVDGTTLTLTYDEPLDGTSMPAASAFTVAGGSQSRTVTGVRVSGSAVELTLDPAVEQGETGIRVSYTVPTGMGASPIRDAVGNAALGLSSEPVTNETPDTIAPTVSTVEITSDPGSDRIYALEDEIQATVTFSEPVDVERTPRLMLKVGERNRPAGYLDGTGTTELVFGYEVVDGDEDTDGVSIDADSLSLNGGTIKDGSNNSADLDHDGLAADSGHKVDAVKPVLAATDPAIVNAATLTLSFDESLDRGSTPLASAFRVTGGSSSRTVTDVALSGSTVLLTLDPAVEHGDTGIRVSYTVPTGVGASPLQDVVRNAAAALTNLAVTNETPDTSPPKVSTISFSSDPGTDRTYAAGEDIEVTVTFSKEVAVTGSPQLTLNVGGTDRTAGYGSVTGAALTFSYRVAAAESDTDGVSIDANSLSLNSGTIKDSTDDIDAVLNHRAVAANAGHKVDGVKPELATAVGAVANGATLTLTYDEPLDGTSMPAASTFTVAGGSQSRTVSGVRVSGSTVELTVDPVVEQGETGIRVSYTVPTGMGVSPIRDAVGNAALGLSSEPVTNETPDTIAPAVSTVEITSDPGSDRIYALEDEIQVTVTFSEPVDVERTPRLMLKVGDRNRPAGYLEGTGTTELVFGYEVVKGDEDTDGVSIEANSLSLSGGTIKDASKNSADLDHDGVAADSGHKVDGAGPDLADTDPARVDAATLTLTFDEPLDRGSTPQASAFRVTGGDASRTVTDVALSGSTVLLTLDPAVEHGDTGIRVSYTVPTGTGVSPLQDVLGNDADRLSNAPVTNETPDTTPPTVSKLEITSNPGTDRTYAAEDDIQVTVTFSETVEVTGTPRLQIELGGESRTADYQGGSGTAALVFEYEVAEGESDTDGVGVEADSLTGGTIRDEARNNAVLGHAGLAADSGHKVDAVKPELAASGGAVVDGTMMTLTFDEPLDRSSTPALGDFTVSGGDQARTVSRVSVNGSTVLLTLSAGAEHLEAGIQVSYTPGDNPIQDVPGNDAEALSREPVTNDTPDTASPTVSSLAITSSPGSNQTYAAGEEIEVEVRFSETVEVTGTPQLRLKVGTRNRTAGYDSGTGTAALVFAYEVADGDEDTGGVSIEAGRIALNGGTIEDEADNPADLAHEAVATQAGHQVDGVRPAFVSAAVDGASLTLTYGEALDRGSSPNYS